MLPVVKDAILLLEMFDGTRHIRVKLMLTADKELNDT